MLSLSTPPKPDQETQEGPRAGAFLRLLLMHFYSGLLMYFLSGVDTRAIGGVPIRGSEGSGAGLSLFFRIWV